MPLERSCSRQWSKQFVDRMLTGRGGVFKKEREQEESLPGLVESGWIEVSHKDCGDVIETCLYHPRLGVKRISTNK